MNGASGTDILLAEDEINVLLSLEFILKSQGYSVVTAVNGREALEKIQIFHPKIAILDVMMPEMTGFQVADQVKNHLKLDLKIILLTAKSLEEEKISKTGLGIDEYLLKPYNPDKLLDMIEKNIKTGSDNAL